MEQVIQLLLGSWTGQLTLFIMVFMLGMVGYFVHLFLQHTDQDQHRK